MAICNLERVYDLMATIPPASRNADQVKAHLKRTLLAQDNRPYEARTLDACGLLLFNPAPEFGLPLVEALITGHYDSAHTIVPTIVEKLGRNEGELWKLAIAYPVAIASIMAATNWCQKYGETANEPYDRVLPHLIGSLVGQYVTRPLGQQEVELPDTFYPQYTAALSGYLDRKLGLGAFRRADGIMDQLHIAVATQPTQDATFRFLQELLNRITLLFAQRHQIQMLRDALKTAHITSR